MGAQKKLIVLVMFGFAVVGLGAQGTVTLVPPRPSASVEPLRLANDGRKVVGQIVDSQNMPVGHAKVQLRNLLTGNVEQATETNENGDYAFIVLGPGTYVVELVLPGGRILALSSAVLLSGFETLRTNMQLPGRWDVATRSMVTLANASSLMGMSAATTMTAETVRMALAQSIQPVDSGEPVSPFKP